MADRFPQFDLPEDLDGSEDAWELGAAGQILTPETFQVDSLRVYWAQMELPAASGATAAVGQASEADTAQPLASAQQRAVSQATEADSAQVVVARQATGLGQPAESSTAQPIGQRQQRELGQPSESDAAQAITARLTAGVGQASEADSAQSILLGGVGVAVGQAVEIDSALSVVAVVGDKLRVYWASFEVPAAGGPVALGLASETDQAQPVGRALRRSVAQAQETDSAQPIAGGAAAPAISGVGDTTPSHTEALTISGSNFGASQGTGGVTIGGVTQTVTAWGNTSITVTVARGTNKYGVAVNVVVTSGAGLSSSPFALTSLQPQTGWAYVDVGTPNTTAANRITASPDIASGDQIAYETVGAAVEVFDDATFSAGSGVTEFDVEVWTPGDGWGSVATQGVGSFSGAVGLVTETDSAQAILARQLRAVGIASETSAAQAVGRRQAATLGQPVETGSAQPVVASRSITIGQSAEVDSAQPVARRQLGALGQSVESDAAQQFGSGGATIINPAAESDTAQPIARVLRLATGIAVETDASQPIAAAQRAQLGQPAEADSAQPLIVLVTQQIGQASESDAALAVLRRLQWQLGQAVEVDEAFRFSAPGYEDDPSTYYRYDVPAGSLRFDVPGLSLRLDIPGQGLRFDVPSIGQSITLN